MREVCQSIAPLGDGTFAVRFYRNGQPVYLRVDADLPVTAGGSLAFAQLGPENELWVPLTEKAWAYFRSGQNSYVSIISDWMWEAYPALTGGQATYQATTGASAQTLANYITYHLNAGHAMSAASYDRPASPVVGKHAYMIKSIRVAKRQHVRHHLQPLGQGQRRSHAV